MADLLSFHEVIIELDEQERTHAAGRTLNQNRY